MKIVYEVIVGSRTYKSWEESDTTCTTDKERPERQTLQIGRWWFYEAKEVPYKTGLGRPQTDLFTHQHLHTEVSAGRAQYHPDGVTNTLPSQVCTLKMTPALGRVGRMYIPRTGNGCGVPWSLSSLGVDQQSHLLDDLLQQYPIFAFRVWENLLLHHVEFSLT